MPLHKNVFDISKNLRPSENSDGFSFCSIYNKKNKTQSKYPAFCFGGDEGDRTPYLLNAIQALSQVSYTPEILTQLLPLQLMYCSRNKMKNQYKIATFLKNANIRMTKQKQKIQSK
jgi:hypothetical protein